MDPLTHAAFGVVCALACASGKKELLRPAALTGLAAGQLPDLDIFLKSETDPLFNLEYHRHFTHALVFAPVIALLATVIVVSLWRLLGRKRIPVRSLFLPALVAAMGHGFCDVWTSYGTRSWWPFSDQRVTLDLIAVIDPVFSLPLLILAILAWWLAKRRLAWFAISWVAIYLTLCVVQQHRAKDVLLDWVSAQGLPAPERITVKPSFANIIVWRGLVVHNNTLRVTAIRVGAGEPQLLSGHSLPLFASADTAIQQLRLKPDSSQAKAIKRFAHFSDDWIGPHPSDSNVIGDLRYAALPHDIMPLWGIRVNPDQPDSPVEMCYFREIRKSDLEKFWAMIQGSGWK